MAAKKTPAPTPDDLKAAKDAVTTPASEEAKKPEVAPALQDTASADKAAEIRARLLGPPVKKSEAKPKVEPAAKPEEDDEPEETVTPSANGEADDNDEPTPAKKPSRAASRDEDDDEDDDVAPIDLSDETLELAEELGYTRSKAKRVAAELGSEAAFENSLKLAAKMVREHGPRSQDRTPAAQQRQPQRQEKQEPAEGELSADEKSLLQDLVLEGGNWDEDVKGLVSQITAHVTGKVKGLLGLVHELRGELNAVKTQAVQRDNAELSNRIDKLFAEASKESDKLAERFGSVPLRKLSDESPLRKAREEVYEEMQLIQQLRVERGKQPLDLDELFQRAVAEVCPEFTEERVEKRLQEQNKPPRATTVLRPNGRQNTIDTMPRGPERAARRLAERVATGRF